MLPGVTKLQKQMAGAGVDDKSIRRQAAIIQSMTKQERRTPKILNASRKKRVASGSGTSAQEINRLLKQHMEMGRMMKKMGKMGGLKGLSSMFGGGSPSGGDSAAGAQDHPNNKRTNISDDSRCCCKDIGLIVGGFRYKNRKLPHVCPIWRLLKRRIPYYY